MANYCFNKIRVYGNRDELIDFKETVESSDSAFCFNKIKPLPKKCKNYDEWIKRNWGVNRLPLYTTLQDNHRYLSYELATAWVPPTGIFRNMFLRFPNHHFDIHCHEEFNLFNYELEFKDGRIVKDKINRDGAYYYEND
jgi:hypothetical protein